MTIETHADRERARQRWDATAAGYDQLGGHGRVTAAEESVWRGLFARLLDPARHPRVLDVGTGTGFLALLLARRGHQVTAIDFSEPMLAIAERKAAAAGLPITFRLGDAYEPALQGQVSRGKSKPAAEVGDHREQRFRPRRAEPHSHRITRVGRSCRTSSHDPRRTTRNPRAALPGRRHSRRPQRRATVLLESLTSSAEPGGGGYHPPGLSG
ncbi:MAG: class I SAM-dependent methyltransferase [Pseudonocardiaceae bacterium]